jgi:2-polyprenyl-6-methoxyphenol hydroxylase-like FAD-dependent oxidoreductase
MRNARILISGAGIAGPALAHWLLRRGFTPMLVERAPSLRTGGYMIDFWGVGYEVAERMGLLPRLNELGYRIGEVAFVDRAGRRVSGFNADRLRRVLMGRFISLERGDLAKAIFDTVSDRIETVFDDCVQSVVAQGDELAVTFEHQAPRYFDLAIGADGLHSAVRRIAFGPERSFARHLGYWAASFIADDYPHRDEHAYVSRGRPGRQASRYALRGGRSAFLFVFVADGDTPPDDMAARKALIADRFQDDGWELPEILARLEEAKELYFDTVSQIRMPQWSTGRVGLIGDAAFCPSLLAGEGAGLALAAAYVLAGELARARDFRQAFNAYEARLRDFIEPKQDSARKLARAFAPQTELGLVFRDMVLRAMALPPVARWTMRSLVEDKFTLPDYGT